MPMQLPNALIRFDAKDDLRAGRGLDRGAVWQQSDLTELQP
jgi:hypothetical protein